MLPDYIIIIGLIVAHLIPLTTVVMFFKIDSNPKTRHLLPTLDSYELPDESANNEAPKLLPHYPE
ncbi:hypothetical protein FIV42_25065 [Persicimonas caeni]|uniref:Uncharacterized protein n=1 Tax=Persicimonas caeni TaxID=2292766 RepID=A0A4Y6Q052_PERCE|nr:hypothetical protein [Persicimonas caeni]QDG53893.1 hypothetical protein FIV42_25065 [Persicimonas caeni]QED35114.1 hypothetical protein FRD00_25060 [Persicimonas caeni]